MSGGCHSATESLKSNPSCPLCSPAFNNLNGQIPSEIAKLAPLGKLTLRDNQLTGTIPMQLGDFNSNILMNLGRNLLSGTIPANLFHGQEEELPSASNYAGTLSLFDNLLTGSIPSEAGTLKKYLLTVHTNNLSGTIPTELYDSKHIRTLWLRGNDQVC